MQLLLSILLFLFTDDSTEICSREAGERWVHYRYTVARRIQVYGKSAMLVKHIRWMGAGLLLLAKLLTLASIVSLIVL